MSDDDYNPQALGEREELCEYCLAKIPHAPLEFCEVTKDTEEVEETEPTSMKDYIDDLISSVDDEPAKRGRPTIDNGADMKDPISTGRKRAAIAAPILGGMICEWAYLKSAGGGVNPIVGCTGYPATDRHHGPNKATLDNTTSDSPAEDGTWNLHRICAMCHNRWHAANDKYYNEPRPPENTVWLPKKEYELHDPVTKLSKEEVFIIEMKRGQRIGD